MKDYFIKMNLVSGYVDRRHPGEWGREEWLEPAPDGVGGVEEVVHLMDGRTGHASIVGSTRSLE